MGFSNKVIQQAIREQMRGKVPDLNRIKREMEAGKLSCGWEKDQKGKLVYAVRLTDRHGMERTIHAFYNVKQNQVSMIRSKVEGYGRNYRIRLSQLSNMFNPQGIKQVQDDLDRLVYGIKKIELEEKEEKPNRERNS